MSDFDNCHVCGDAIPDDYGKFDSKAPVYADTYTYHKGCEDGVFDEVYCEL